MLWIGDSAPHPQARALLVLLRLSCCAPALVATDAAMAVTRSIEDALQTTLQLRALETTALEEVREAIMVSAVCVA